MPAKKSKGTKPNRSATKLKKVASGKRLRGRTQIETTSGQSLQGNNSTNFKINDILFYSLSQAIRELLVNPERAEAIAVGLKLLGEVTEVDRVYLFENDAQAPGEPLATSQRYEWNSGTAEPQIDNPELQNLPYSQIEPCYEPLAANKPYIQIVRKMKAGNFKRILEEEDIQSILLFPIFIENLFWGFIGFDECKYERIWTEIEISILRAYSAAIAAAVERDHHEKSYRDLFDSVGEAIYIQNYDGTFIDVNKFACTMYGYEKKDILGKTLLFLAAEGKYNFDDIKARTEKAAQGVTQLFEFWGQKKNGEIFLKEIRLTKGSYFGQDIIMATAWDITERKKSEQALRDSEQRFRTLQQASFGGIGLHDQGKILDCNQGLCDITGYSYDELIGRNGLELIAPHWRDFVFEKIKTGYDKPYDVEGIRKDGSRYFLEIRGKNVPYHVRTIRVTEFRDITERKRTEEKIIEQNARLLAVSEDLRRKNNQLEEFTQIVSHNLRSPVGNILTLLNFFESGVSDDERAEYFNLLKEAAFTTFTMLNELNEVLKVRQSHNIEKQELKFENVLLQVKAMLNARITELSASVISDFSLAPLILYPSIYLESIILNLLDNALKYHSSERQPAIHFTTYKNSNGHIILEVKDNGLGINLDRYKHQVFKLRKTFHRHPESRGIGLFMIKNQIEAMGGEITISSTENEGTTFFVNFNKHQSDGS